VLIQLSEEHEAIREGVAKVCGGFDDEYWSACDTEKRFPFEFHRAMADGGWLGITMPENLGGANLGVTGAAIMMHTISSSAGGYSAASTVHLNLFGPHAVVVFGTDEQKERMLRPLIAGTDRACFGVTEPDAGLDTTSITTFATKVEGGYRVTGRKIWTSSAQVSNKILLLTRTTPRDLCRKPTDGMTLFYTDLDKSQIEVRRIAKMGRNAVDSNASISCTASIPSESWSASRRSAWARGRWPAPPDMQANASCSAGRSAPTRASSIRLPRTGPILNPPSG
jgi:acyl-CoA dehydrogenase